MSTSLQIPRAASRRCAALFNQSSISPQPHSTSSLLTSPCTHTRFASTTAASSDSAENAPITRSSKFMISSRPEDQFKRPPTYLQTGTVSRVGTMPQTVQITQRVQTFDKFLQKHYTRPLRLKAHDPNPSGFLREGDVVQFGRYHQHEKDEKKRKNEERVKSMTERLGQMKDGGKALRKFLRTEETRQKLKGNKERGVQFVVRRVVTPFGVGLEERGRVAEVETDQATQPLSRIGGQDGLAKGLSGSPSRQSGSAAVAG